MCVCVCVSVSDRSHSKATSRLLLVLLYAPPSDLQVCGVGSVSSASVTLQDPGYQMCAVLPANTDPPLPCTMSFPVGLRAFMGWEQNPQDLGVPEPALPRWCPARTFNASIHTTYL